MKKSGKSWEYALSEEQLAKLWKSCSELLEKVLIGLLAYCGLRVGEAVHLKLAWIREGEIHIPSSMPCGCHACSKRPKSPGVWVPKSKAGIRVIPIPNFLKPILTEFLQYQPDGLDLTRISSWYRVQHLARKAKLPKVFPHSLRATCATILATKGFNAAEICYIMGWARISMGEHYIRIAQAKDGARRKMKEIYG